MSGEMAGTSVPAVVKPTFLLPLGPDAALVPRTAALSDAYHRMLLANQQRLAHWERWAAEPMTRESTRAFLDASGRAWLDGTQLPTAIAVSVPQGWRLAGSAGLRIDHYNDSAEAGYWIDAAHEGRGLITRALTALIEQAFGPLGLHRVVLRIDAGNDRSRAVARRLGFTEEGRQRQAIFVQGSWRDDVLYGLLADEWPQRAGNSALFTSAEADLT